MVFASKTAKTKWDSQFAAATAGKGEDDCWEWQGTVQRTYGRFGQRKAHRVSWELVNGPIAESAFLLHSCDNPICINPKHLREGDALQNARDAVERGRTAKGEKNGRAKLTREQVYEIQVLHGRVPISELVLRFGVSQAQINNIVSGRRWGH
jgi:hypothetical protein